MSYETFHDVQRQLEQLVGDLDAATPRGKTRARILDAAAQQFVRHGYRKASIDEIAKQAGIGKGTLYLHFATKTDVLVAALAREKLRALDLLRAAFSN
ncbi:MAG TPA: helix-turn-helix domain-containing protein, partial [Nannocystis sp.]